MNRMYEENRKSVNDFIGCLHHCVYCKPSFQRQAKRFEGKGYDFQPRFHPERLLKAPPKTVGDEFIFIPSMGDIAFATKQQMQAHIDYAKKYSDRTFLMQSKDPFCFLNYSFPSNVILATTIETNRLSFNTPSNYTRYIEISKAPHPIQRLEAMLQLKERNENRIANTIEPVLQFTKDFIFWFERLMPNITYIGYDNHGCKLPEPLLSETQQLIEKLKPLTDLRIKNLRKAWFET